MNLILLGPQASGKGTQARLLSQKYNLFYFESGGFLRNLAKTTRPDIGERMNKGELIPGEETSKLIQDFFEKKGITDNILFEGYPRTIEQHDSITPWFLKHGIKIDAVLVIKLDEEESIRRLSARRMDPVTGKIYNLITEPPGPEVDKDKLVQREDDKPDAIRKRLDLYAKNTKPLIEIYKKEGNVFEVDGSKSIDEVQADLVSIIEKVTQNV